MLNEDQARVFGLITQGHNICLTGQAGAGKTSLIKEASQQLASSGKSVAVTALTGRP